MKADRFWLRVAIADVEVCWEWLGPVDNRGGYGVVRFEGRMTNAHRVAYLLAKGPIPAGMTVDHQCFTPACCNPGHLRLLTRVENSRQSRRALRDHCKNGHPFDQANTRWYLQGKSLHRVCRACQRDAQRRAVAKRRVAA